MRGGSSDLAIGVLTTSYPSGLLTQDGSGRTPGRLSEGAGLTSAGGFVRGFCLACARAGHRVEVLCPEPADPALPLRDPGVRVAPLAYFRPRGLQFLSSAPGAPEALTSRPWLWAPALAFSARLTAACLSRRGGYGVVVSHWLLPCGLAAALASNAPHLAIAHGSDVHLLERMAGGARIARWLVRQRVSLAFVSGSLRRRFAALLTRDLQRRLLDISVVQPMGVCAGELVGGDRVGTRARMGLQGPVALWMGRMTPLKRAALAVDLARVMPELTLVLAGGGPEEERLRRSSRPLGTRVRFVGWVGSAERADLLAAADLLVITSTVLPDGRGDGAPVVAREALAAGLPVVSTTPGGLAEARRLGAPVELVEDGDLGALVTGARWALHRGRLGGGSRERLARELDWQVVLPRLLAQVSGQG